tara:strand:- start:761 stop:892 length:132 start_codon:yes stop_codon:yes gene_type:complete
MDIIVFPRVGMLLPTFIVLVVDEMDSMSGAAYPLIFMLLLKFY